MIEVDGLATYKVKTLFDCLNLLRRGERNKHTRMKKLNSKGLRASSLFQFCITINQPYEKTLVTGQATKTTKFNFCDLSSSDRVSAQEEIDARHLVDLKKLNLGVKTITKVLT